MSPAARRIHAFVRATNYLVVSQLYLQNNYLLSRPLIAHDIKPRLIGHWGTCPGINFVYAHLNYFLKNHPQHAMFVLGPGHGFAALQANLFLEGTLGAYYPQATQTADGIAYIAKNFSWPHGFQSHSNPTTPGTILEGGELGYSLSTAYGAVLDNPDLLVACLVGDGEAETGPLAASWHANKFIHPTTDGTVLPILHLNGYKISGPTIFGRMSDEELVALFTGYGYEPHIVEGETDEVYDQMIQVLETCHRSITQIKAHAKNSHSVLPHRFPMIILKTPKGWTGIKTLDGNKIEDNCLSHQIVAGDVKTNPVHLKALEQWMRSYAFEEVFHPQGGFSKDIQEILPDPLYRMGAVPHAYAGKRIVDLKLPGVEEHAESVKTPGVIGSSSMKNIGKYLAKVLVKNEGAKNMRIFSPDEIYSNKIDDVLTVTNRAFEWPIKEQDIHLAQTGRVIEMLSEHTLQGLLEGYTLTGRHGVFVSYEAFISIVSSMVDQYLKFLKVACDVPWRMPIPSLTIILTASGWRQEHNGFSHQNPGFIGHLMTKRGNLVHIFFPPDANTALVCLRHSLEMTNVVNIVVAGKTVEPRWVGIEDAERLYKEGMMTWKFASDPNPDIVLVGIGDYLVKECLAAISYVRSKTQAIKMQFVDVLDLNSCSVKEHKKAPRHEEFHAYFTHDKPVIVNFHGNPETVKPLLIEHEHPERFSVHGYIDHGSITTPFDMHVINRTSRLHLAIEIFETMAARNVITTTEAHEYIQECERLLKEHQFYIKTYGVDPDYITNWQWNEDLSSRGKLTS